MKTLTFVLAAALLPSLALAHGGHSDAGADASVHGLAHLLYFGLPVAIAAAALWRAVAKAKRD